MALNLPQQHSHGATVPVWADYTLAERDRRWAAVRAGASKAGFDCIFVPLGDGLDARYLTQLRCSSIVLPTDGRPPIAIADRGSSNAWFPEPRQTSRQWADPMAQALLDLGMERAHVGVAGLLGGVFSHVRAFDGVVVHSAFEQVMSRLPHATFADATDIVGQVRSVKSEEEIACLRRATEIAEQGVEEMVAQAHPGMDAAVLYARVMSRMLQLGSEYYPLAIRIGPIDGPEPRRLTNPPIGLRLQPNMLVTNEVCAVWGVQQAQEDQPILLGTIPESWKPVIELQHEVFDAGLERMKPGTTFGELIDFVNGFGEHRGGRTSILLHGRGAGDDGPLLTPRSRGENVRGLRIEQGNAFVWKPTARSEDGRIAFTWGGDVVVNAGGAERLFKRPHGMVSIS